MDRAEKVGLGLAAGGHVVLFGLLSVGFLATPNPEKLRATPVEVSLVPEVALESAAPAPAADPAQSVAPAEGPPEDAAPPEPAPAPPEPAPPEPRPAPPFPTPTPKPAPPKPAAPKPAPPKPAPAPKPAPVPKPAPKPVPKPPQPRPAAQPKPAAKPAPAQPKAAARPARPAAQPKQAAPAARRGTGATQTASAARPRGSRLGDDFLRGLSPEPLRSANPNPPAATMSAKAAADIGQAIRRQVQPCANRNVSPGPGAGRIVVTMSLRLNRDGSLAARPSVTGRSGVDADNERYAERVEDLAVAAFVACAPLRGLPAELYDVPRGWRNFKLNYKLPG